MKLVVALLLIGQIRSYGDDLPPLSSELTPQSGIVDSGDAATVPPQFPSSGAPRRPATRMVFGDSPRDSLPSTPASVPDVGAPPSLYGAAPGRASFEPDTSAAASLAAASLAAARASSSALQVAAELIGEILTLDDSAGQSVHRTRLVDVVTRAADAPSQAAAIGAYWGLAQAIAQSRYAAGNVQFLDRVPKSSQDSDRALLEAEVALADAQAEAARDKVLAAQYRLLRAAAMPWDGILPWPADLPLVTPYRTNFDTYYSQRPAPLEIRYIHQSLPNKLQLIERRVTALAAAESATDASLESYQRGGIPLSLLLLSIDRMEQARQSFIESVVDYNLRIADYSLATVGSTLGPETLVSTLIRTTPVNAALVTIPREVRPANAQTSITSQRTIVRRNEDVNARK